MLTFIDVKFTYDGKATDLQVFRVFSQHSKWVITPVNQ